MNPERIARLFRELADEYESDARDGQRRSRRRVREREPYRPANPVSETDLAAAREGLRRAGLIAVGGKP